MCQDHIGVVNENSKTIIDIIHATGFHLNLTKIASARRTHAVVAIMTCARVISVPEFNVRYSELTTIPGFSGSDRGWKYRMVS